VPERSRFRAFADSGVAGYLYLIHQQLSATLPPTGLLARKHRKLPVTP
jgi:hypothetical protein